MLRIIAVFMLLMFSVGCTSTSSIHEEEHLVTMTHNKSTDYTLLVYSAKDGAIRQVLRYKGAVELILIELPDGEYRIKKRGEDFERVAPEDVYQIKSRLESLIFADFSQQGSRMWNHSS